MEFSKKVFVDFCGILHLRELEKSDVAGFSYIKIIAIIIAYAHYCGDRSVFLAMHPLMGKGGSGFG